jgi:hypothetical protein
MYALRRSLRNQPRLILALLFALEIAVHGNGVGVVAHRHAGGDHAHLHGPSTPAHDHAAPEAATAGDGLRRTVDASSHLHVSTAGPRLATHPSPRLTAGATPRIALLAPALRPAAPPALTAPARAPPHLSV